jgi:hypothetical protein
LDRIRKNGDDKRKKNKNKNFSLKKSKSQKKIIPFSDFGMSNEVVFRPIQPTDSKERLAELVTAAFTKLEKYDFPHKRHNWTIEILYFLLPFSGPQIIPILAFHIELDAFIELNIEYSC